MPKEQERSKILLFRGLNSLVWDRKLTMDKPFLQQRCQDRSLSLQTGGIVHRRNAFILYVIPRHHRSPVNDEPIYCAR